MRPPAAPLVRYGDDPEQVANLHLPVGEGPFPCAVLVHGGFWRDRWDRTLMTPLACDLAARGIAAWNLEYRRVGRPGGGGGFPGTLEDVAAGVDHLRLVPEVDTARVGAIGHSAGGHLALWLAAREAAVVMVRAVAAQAAVTDLARACAERLGDGAVEDFLGGAATAHPDRLARAAVPAAALRETKVLLVHGTRDEDVPAAYSADLAAELPQARLELFAGDHFDVVDAGHDAWRLVADWIVETLGGNRG
ncbi:MAG: alpha/beta hydrolase family protein [Gaiella sp.]